MTAVATAARPGLAMRFHVSGMDCADCAFSVENAVAAAPGVERARVHFGGATLKVVPHARGALPGAGSAATEALTVRMTREAFDSTLARILHLVEEAQGSKAPAQRQADRVAARFRPAGIAGQVALAAFGFFSLWIAVGADTGSALAVALNGVRLALPGRAKRGCHALEAVRTLDNP